MVKQEKNELGSRDRILHAAMTMFGENPAATLSVRAVAARAGLSTGSLRYHFPTQRDLQDAVLTGLYDLVVPNDRIHDQSLPARDRLVECLRQVLAPVGTREQARKAWGEVFRAFIEPEPTAEIRAAYDHLERETQGRVEYWLTVLTNEGALEQGDNNQRARFLNTVISGLAFEKALPSESSTLQHETEMLSIAVDSVFAART